MEFSSCNSPGVLNLKKKCLVPGKDGSNLTTALFFLNGLVKNHLPYSFVHPNGLTTSWRILNGGPILQVLQVLGWSSKWAVSASSQDASGRIFLANGVLPQRSAKVWHVLGQGMNHSQPGRHRKVELESKSWKFPGNSCKSLGNSWENIGIVNFYGKLSWRNHGKKIGTLGCNPLGWEGGTNHGNFQVVVTSYKYYLEFSYLVLGEDGSNLTMIFFEMGWKHHLVFFFSIEIE